MEQNGMNEINKGGATLVKSNKGKVVAIVGAAAVAVAGAVTYFIRKGKNKNVETENVEENSEVVTEDQE